MESYKGIGLMSGTSLDGLDMAYCEFKLEKNRWSFQIKHTRCVLYDHSRKSKLLNAENYSAEELALFDVHLSEYFAGELNKFIHEHSLKPDFIASHGHTIFHQTENKLSLQIGKGSVIAALTGIQTICDFRTVDIALGGQGAPLVPVGDRLLFSEYDACLNIGGIANISFEKNNSRLAFDIAPANILLNHYARDLAKDYDKDGNIARSGQVHPELLSELDQLDYYSFSFPKSLGKEWIVQKVFPLIKKYKINLPDTIATCTEHTAKQIARDCEGINDNHQQKLKILVSGGGTHNTYLMERIRHYSKHEFIIPETTLIEFKEALIFAFLGVLRLRNEVNCLSSVTGASRDSCGGAIYQ